MKLFLMILVAVAGFGWWWQKVESPAPDFYNLELEIADTESERARGLSGRAALGENEGMLFIFDEPEMPGFWMKDMHFPIDIIWLDENRQIVGLHENIAPDTYPAIFYPPRLVEAGPPRPIKYVLEVNAGWVAARQLKLD